MITRYYVIVLLLFVLLASGQTQQHSYPSNEYEYSLWRQELQENDKASAGWRYQLNKDEQIVNHYLQYLKWKQFKATEDTGFAPSRPIEEILDNVTTTELYGVLRQMPKGGNMHSHENHQLNKRTLYEIVWNSTDFQHLWILPENHPTSPWTLNFFINPPAGEGWIKVKDDPYYTLERVLQNQIFFGIMNDYAKRYPTDSGERWRQMDALWTRGSDQLISNMNIKELYMEALLIEQIQEGVQYYEARQSFGNPDDKLYYLDASANETYGKRFVDEDGELAINLTLKVVERVKARYPQFIDFKRIVYSYRRSSPDYIRSEMERVYKLRQLHPNHIIGYDMVGEEDAGNSHLYYLQNLLDLYDRSTASSIIPLYFHAVETNWLDDMITAVDDSDPVATIENMFDIVLLHTKRIGHGFALIKHPYILSVLKQRGVAIEICPVSNQILGYTPDLRNHPALHYFRSGHPIVLGADDPGSFGYNHFTIDWHQVYLAWGLDLSDLKTLAYNSLKYSGMTESEKTTAVTKWETQWTNFISTIKPLACSVNYNSNVFIGRVFPRVGANDRATNVTIYGRNFDQAICHDIVCKFGNLLATRASYLANYKIVCETPLPTTLEAELTAANNLTVPIYLSLDGGSNFLDAGNFTYQYPTTTPADSSSATHIFPAFSYLLSIYILRLLV